MKNKSKILKRILIIMLVILIYGIFCSNSYITNNSVYASTVPTTTVINDGGGGGGGSGANYGIGDVFEAMKDTSKPDITETNSGILGTINQVIGLLQVAGTGISIVVITFVGIKYMVASPQEKAELKKSAMPIVIGCVLLFGAVNIIAMVEKFTTVLE